METYFSRSRDHMEILGFGVFVDDVVEGIDGIKGSSTNLLAVDTRPRYPVSDASVAA